MSRISQSWLDDDADELFLAVHHLENLSEIRSFFRDLLTETEIGEFSNRWKITRMLDAGIRYKRIEKVTGASSATIARARRWTLQGSGGFRLVLEKMKS